MVSPFEDFINGMTDSQYEYWLANEATENQYDKAITIREQLDDDELPIDENGDTPQERRNRLVQFLRSLFNRQ